MQISDSMKSWDRNNDLGAPFINDRPVNPSLGIPMGLSSDEVLDTKVLWTQTRITTMSPDGTPLDFPKTYTQTLDKS